MASSVIDTSAIGEIESAGAKDPKLLSDLDQIKVPGLHPAMSMTNLVNHIGNCISEQITSGNSMISSDALQGRDILEEILNICLVTLNLHHQLLTNNSSCQESIHFAVFYRRIM
ncbi:hypothetical protein ACOSQ2_021403 [Xanthoceras sorbifolium]